MAASWWFSFICSTCSVKFLAANRGGTLSEKSLVFSGSSWLLEYSHAVYGRLLAGWFLYILSFYRSIFYFIFSAYRCWLIQKRMEIELGYRYYSSWTFL